MTAAPNEFPQCGVISGMEAHMPRTFSTPLAKRPWFNHDCYLLPNIEMRFLCGIIIGTLTAIVFLIIVTVCICTGIIIIIFLLFFTIQTLFAKSLTQDMFTIVM